EMRERAAQGAILATDTVWQDGTPPQNGSPAGRIIDFRSLGAAETAAPVGIKMAIDPVLFGAKSRPEKRRAPKPATAPQAKAPEPKPPEPTQPSAPEPARPEAAPLSVQLVQVAMVATQLPEAIPVDAPQPAPIPAVELEQPAAPIEAELAEEDAPAAI